MAPGVRAGGRPVITVAAVARQDRGHRRLVVPAGAALAKGVPHLFTGTQAAAGLEKRAEAKIEAQVKGSTVLK